MKLIRPLFILLLVAFLLFYVNLPVLSYGFLGLPFILLLLAILTFFLFTKMEVGADKKVRVLSKPNRLIYFFIAALLIYMVAFPLFTSLPILRSESFKNLIGKVKTGDKIANHISPDRKTHV